MAQGLGLGPIRFPSQYEPYTPPERRRRGTASQDKTGPLRLKPSHAPAGAGGKSGKTGAAGSGTDAALTILPDDVAPAQVTFLLRAGGQRMGGSFAASVGSHVAGVALFMLLLSLAPERVYEAMEVDRDNYDGLIWLPAEGPGGGGGGGGNESLELPAQALLEGPDESALSVPVEEVPEVVEPEPEPEAEPEPEPLLAQELSIPALPIAAAPETRPGLLEGLRAENSNSQGTGTDGGAGSGDGGGAGPGQGDGLGPGEGGGAGGGVYRPGAGVTTPRLLYDEPPKYTAEAMRARIQGTVWLEVVVLPDGTVGDIEVTKSLDRVFGLDEQAIAAARNWRFAPGTRFGEPVAVLVGLELFFNLR